MLRIVPCVDSDELAATAKNKLETPRHVAAALGREALDASVRGYYLDQQGREIRWAAQVGAALSAKLSISPTASLPERKSAVFSETRIRISNETTLRAARRLVDSGAKVLALNFADGIRPGGGFLSGARAQEEGLCRASALFATLNGDEMYEAHARRKQPDSTEWAILSPNVPVFRGDDGEKLGAPWMLSFISCAAPYAPTVGQPKSGDLLEKRIRRILAIARAYGYEALVLGAWGCGAFGNDPQRTARDFRNALEHEYDGTFSDVVFAVTDWSPERRFLGPFREVFSA